MIDMPIKARLTRLRINRLIKKIEWEHTKGQILLEMIEAYLKRLEEEEHK